MHKTDVNLQIAKLFIDPSDLPSNTYMRPNINYKNIFQTDNDIFVRINDVLYKRLENGKLEKYKYKGGRHFIEAQKIMLGDDDE